MPDFKIPNIDMEKAATDVGTALKDAAYVAVGLGLLGFQRAQVQRVELTRQLESQLGNLSDLPSTLGTQAESYLASVREQFGEVISQLSKASGEARQDIPSAAALRSTITDLARAIDDAVSPVRQQIEERIDQVEVSLPEAARGVVHSVRVAAGNQEKAIRSAVGLAS
jgi:ElaB/YqjD/DUF883 family membrane-anchored ribosome-binding protein